MLYRWILAVVSPQSRHILNARVVLLILTQVLVMLKQELCLWSLLQVFTYYSMLHLMTLIFAKFIDQVVYQDLIIFLCDPSIY